MLHNKLRKRFPIFETVDMSATGITGVLKDDVASVWGWEDVWGSTMQSFVDIASEVEGVYQDLPKEGESCKDWVMAMLTLEGVDTTYFHMFNESTYVRIWELIRTGCKCNQSAKDEAITEAFTLAGASHRALHNFKGGVPFDPSTFATLADAVRARKHGARVRSKDLLSTIYISEAELNDWDDQNPYDTLGE